MTSVYPVSEWACVTLMTIYGRCLTHMSIDRLWISQFMRVHSGKSAQLCHTWPLWVTSTNHGASCWLHCSTLAFLFSSITVIRTTSAIGRVASPGHKLLSGTARRNSSKRLFMNGLRPHSTKWEAKSKTLKISPSCVCTMQAIWCQQISPRMLMTWLLSSSRPKKSPLVSIITTKPNEECQKYIYSQTDLHITINLLLFIKNTS